LHYILWEEGEEGMQKGYGSYEKTLKSGSLDARGEKIVFKECA
jgi:hypothetical protein